MSDYYAILQVPKTASNNEIRRAYKKLAMRWHPDRNASNLAKAERKFKKISQAHSVLTNQQKKACYDQFLRQLLKKSVKKQGYREQRWSKQHAFGCFSNLFGIVMSYIRSWLLSSASVYLTRQSALSPIDILHKNG